MAGVAMVGSFDCGSGPCPRSRIGDAGVQMVSSVTRRCSQGGSSEEVAEAFVVWALKVGNQSTSLEPVVANPKAFAVEVAPFPHHTRTAGGREGRQ